MNKRLTALIMIGTLVLISGCQRSWDPSDPGMRGDGSTPHQLGHGVTMFDKNVRNTLVFINKSARRTERGHSQVRVQMQNVRDLTLWADYRVVFYDADNMQIDATEWAPASFKPREVVLLQGVSLQNDATCYNVQFRNLRSKSGRPLSSKWEVKVHSFELDFILDALAN